jgi:cob(I)alamin adenosyltransferase
MRKGYVQVYTGDGKGKTTAALGLALRAAGAGLKVFVGQFVKNRRCSEHRMLERLGDTVTYRQFGCGFIARGPSEGDIAAARKGLAEAAEAVAGGSYDLVILDELNVAVYYGLIDVGEVLGLIARKPAAVELVLTGRNAHPAVMEAADLVTEMRSIKHYYEKGVKARRGIEK